MSLDIRLVDPVTRETLQLEQPHHMRGGTYAVGGTTDARLNVTYNYSPHYYRVLSWPDGIRALDGRKVSESLPVLREAAAKLGNDVDADYWKPTEGNAKRALLQLIALAEMRPDGIWEVE